MDKLISDLEKEMFSVNPDMKKSLAPGLPRAQIESYISRLPFAISPDIVPLYEWSSGAGSKLEILPGAYLFPLDQSLDQFETLYAKKDEFQKIFYEPYYDCFRFLEDYSDGGYAFGRIDSPSKGRIIGLCIHANWKIAYNTLSDLLRTAIECYKRGVFKPRDIPDFEMYFRIGKELNPMLEYWEHA